VAEKATCAVNNLNPPKVVVFRADMLPASETFIKEQMLSFTRWQPLLAGFRFVDGLDLSPLNCKVLSAWLPKRFSPRAIAAFRELDIYPPGLRWQLRRYAPRIVHVHFATDLMAIWPVLRGLGVPVVATLHGYDINIYREFWQEFGRAQRLYPGRLLAAAAHPRLHFIAVSEAIRRRAVEYGIPPDKVSVKYIGVDVARFTPSGAGILERKRRILFVGRMVEKKGAATLIRAFARVRDRVPDAELTMVGEGPQSAEIKQLAANLHLPVQFTGALASDAVREQLSQARVFCLPSITAANGDAEGFPIVILEALASGVPVVSSARGGAAEGIDHGVTGWRLPENDLDALVAALLQSLSDDPLVARMSQAARSHVVSRFDLHKCTGILEDFYDELTDRCGVRNFDRHNAPAAVARQDV
jgi:glycosyltransferase involved in cell wall biosynthesis